MKVEAIRLINFMAFEDTGWIELRPITLLFGRNSSGKSALIRALLLLKQSLDAEGEERPLAFVKENGLVDLGDFATTVHRKPGEGTGESQKRDHLNRSMVFGFRCDLTGEPTLDQVKRLVKASKAVSVTEDVLQTLARAELFIGFGLYDGAVRPSLLDLRMGEAEPSISLLEYRRLAERETADLEVQRSFILNSDVANDPQLDEATIGLRLRDARGFWTTFVEPLSKSFKALDDVLRAVQDGVASFLRGMIHIGPIRPQPERVYALRATDEPRYAREGLKGWYDFLRERVDEAQARSIAEWMRRLGLADDVRARADKDDGLLRRSRVSFDDKVEAVNIRDVGFGASQVLPVIAAAVLSPPDAFVVIEQPELHLHPEAQAALADLFIDLARSGTQFVLETHSEHFLLRFQRRVAETSIETNSPDPVEPRNEGHALKDGQISVQFVTREITSSVEHIYLDKAGRLFTRDESDNKRDTSDKFNAFFRTDYVDARLLGRAMSEILSQPTSAV
ncbi:MAG: hypothetical protein KatS3mg053_1465 [Candidatus Roseilinea sp.]|nr:MAG: hypothetical protein KatS3mg053_1465 [Candidatus Roseilinea sp.]